MKAVLLRMTAAALLAATAATGAWSAPLLAPDEAAALSGSSFNISFEAGGGFGNTRVNVDPGFGVPVTDTLDFSTGFVGFDARFNFGVIGARPTVVAPNTALSPGFAIGVKVRSFPGDDTIALRPFPGVDATLTRDVDWSVTAYAGFPIVWVAPGLPSSPRSVTITPFVGATYQEEKIRLVERGGFLFVANEFEAPIKRWGVALGLDIDAGYRVSQNLDLTFGGTVRATALPDTTAPGISSLGLIGDARIESGVDVYVGVRVGARLYTDYTPFLDPVARR